MKSTSALPAFPWDNETVLHDYKIAYTSRQASLLGRKEVLNGRAKFGIFGDGKELPQLAMARFFNKGDWRAGYYRDQTFMLAAGMTSVSELFAQLYADPDLDREPSSGGRQMNAHFSTRYVDRQGRWLNQTELKNSSADISPTAAQMPRLLGLAYASKLYRTWTSSGESFSVRGNELAFGTIGNASTSEGLFWESVNAAAVLQVPMLISVWDDGYGISVPNRYQTAKGSISEAVRGFQSEREQEGFDLYTVCGYDYLQLMLTYQTAAQKCRRTHKPCLIHVLDLTQPQGHSTSGSHERYKSKERLQYEESIDGLKKFREWILEKGVVSLDELDTIEKELEREVESARKEAWHDYQCPIDEEKKAALVHIENLVQKLPALEKVSSQLRSTGSFFRRQVQSALEQAVFLARNLPMDEKRALLQHLFSYRRENSRRYNTHLYSEFKSPLRAVSKPARFDTKVSLDGRQIIQKFFEKKLAEDPRIFILGEDVGRLGGVNLEFEGLQELYGEWKVTDTGIREATILGQGFGAAMRGLRPIVDIQYLDYVLYALQGLSDDVATLSYRTVGGQLAPVIIRTKGHRLEGIWHTGSPMGMLLGSVRGLHLCVPRNATQAVGMYQTLLEGDDPALVIEVLNGYRLKEVLPSNLGEYSVPLGVCEILLHGKDLTIVTYGSCVRIAEEAAKELEGMGISIELIDVQTLLPFDRDHAIRLSLEKTHAVIFLDEDYSGGASAYMLQKVLVEQGAYDLLDAPPVTLSAKDHRSAYGSDGDFFSKPQVEDIVHAGYGLMRERYSRDFPSLI